MLDFLVPEAAGVRALPATMRPISFNGSFGWLHAPPDGVGLSTAIVLCSGLKTDGLTGHRPLRLLAAALAGAGYCTLRFDYPATGDSQDLNGADHWSSWLDSIHRAVDWLRDQSGARNIVLGGFRFGATLAATVAAERSDIGGLMLFAPVLLGRSFIRQLTLEGNLRPTPSSTEQGLDVHEFQFSVGTVRHINQADLRRVAFKPGCQVAVFVGEQAPVLSECIQVWRAKGATVTQHGFAGLEAMQRPSFMSYQATVDGTGVLAWLRSWAPTDPASPQRRLPVVELRHPGCVETPLQFGEEGALFGMLCRPTGRESDLVVIIGSSSGDPHHGRARVNVDLARQLAREGIASLRMDFAGLGDSIAPGDAATHVFETDRHPDISAAIDALAALGFRRFAMEGLCSGAFHAFHTAMTEPRLSVLLLVNLPLFEWRTGDSIELLSHTIQSPTHFLKKLVLKDIWQRFFQGRLDVMDRIGLQVDWLFSKIKGLRRRLWAVMGIRIPPSFVQDCVQRLSQRTSILFLYSDNDAGLPVLMREFHPNRLPFGSTVKIVPGLDHSLTGSVMRQVAAKHMIAFLHSHVMFPSALPDASP